MLKTAGKFKHMDLVSMFGVILNIWQSLERMAAKSREIWSDEPAKNLFLKFIIQGALKNKFDLYVALHYIKEYDSWLQR